MTAPIAIASPIQTKFPSPFCASVTAIASAIRPRRAGSLPCALRRREEAEREDEGHDR
jgi:hypothetical protein